MQLQLQLPVNLFTSGLLAAPAQCTNALHLHTNVCRVIMCVSVSVADNNQVNQSVGQSVKDIAY